MVEENQVTMNVEENQETTKGPKKVTTKDPKKVEEGNRLAEWNHKNKKAKKELILWHWGHSSCGGDRPPWLLPLSSQGQHCTSSATTPSN